MRLELICGNGLNLNPPIRGSQSFARAQTQIDEALVACALERHRLAHGKLPERLEELVPRFLNHIPNDVINGEPLKYRRTADDQFLLWSVGWNEVDDGGVIAFEKESKKRLDFEQGDWVWSSQSVER